MSLNKGIVALYELDETSGDAVDSTGNNPGKVIGCTQGVTGKIGTAYTFVKSNGDYIDCGNTDVLKNLEKFSVSFWVKFDAINGYDSLVCKGFSGGYSWWIRTVSDGSAFQFRLQNSQIVESTTTPTTDTWYHVVCVYDGSTIKIYVNNGTPDSETAVTDPAKIDQSVNIGRDPGLPARLLDATLDQVIIFDFPLTASHVDTIYNNGDGLAYPFPGDSVFVGTGGVGSKIINRNYPYDSGLVAGTTKQEGRDPALTPDDSSVLDRDKVGL